MSVTKVVNDVSAEGVLPALEARVGDAPFRRCTRGDRYHQVGPTENRLFTRTTQVVAGGPRVRLKVLLQTHGGYRTDLFQISVSFPLST